MKNTYLLSLVGFALLAAACGKYEKNPVPDLQQLRENGKLEMAKLPEKPKDDEATKGPEKPKEITKTVVVVKEVPVTKEAATVNGNFIVIAADSDMNFTEGQAATYQIVGRSLIKGVGIKLEAQGLPAGAVFQAAPTEQEPARYTLTWTPDYNTVAANTVIRSYKFKVTAQITDVPANVDRKALDAMTRQQELKVLVIKNTAAPTDLAVNLPDSVNEGSVTPFQVTVRVPGVDDKSGQKPKVSISYDLMMTTQGNDYLELDGSRYVIADITNQDAQYLGDYRWKFPLKFDTQNISVQPPRNMKGEVLATADSTHVRLNVKVFAPSGSSTPEIVKKVQIVLTKPVDAPKFDLSGLGKESLDLTPGETMTLNFLITSSVSGSSLKVDLPNVKTLVGSPSLSCKASQASAAKQECTLSWKVPCSANDNDLAQQINMSAVATSAGRSSQVTNYTLKIVRSQKEKAASCTPVAPAQASASAPAGSAAGVAK